MKRFVFALLLVLTLGTVFANPIEVKPIGRIWFTPQDSLHLEFNDHMSNVGITDIQICDGVDTYNYNVEFTYQSCPSINIPGTNLSRQSGMLQIDFQTYLYQEVHWGSSIENDFSSLVEDQVITNVLIHDWDNSYWLLAKDYSPTEDGYQIPNARSTINIQVLNQNGTPVANHPVYYCHSYLPEGLTDADGMLSLSKYCCKTRLWLRSEDSWDIVDEVVFFAEPDSTYNVVLHTASSSVDDFQSPQAPASLSLYPSVMRFGQSDGVSVSYPAKLSSSAQLQLFDLKGRLLTSREYSGKQEMWQLPQLSSGVYFVRLSDGARVLGNSKLIVLK